MNVGSVYFPGWLVLLVVGVLVMFAFGLWSKVWEWVKGAWTKTMGTEAEGPFVDWVDSGVLYMKSLKVQQALRIAQIEFEARGDEKNVAAIDKMLADVAVWKDYEVEYGDEED